MHNQRSLTREITITATIVTHNDKLLAISERKLFEAVQFWLECEKRVGGVDAECWVRIKTK